MGSVQEIKCIKTNRNNFMIQLSKGRILEWQKILKEEYSKEVSFAEASETANNLVEFFDLLLKIDIRQNPQNYTEKRVYGRRKFRKIL